VEAEISDGDGDGERRCEDSARNVRQLVAAVVRFTLEEDASTDLAVVTAGGRRARSVESVAARRSAVEASDAAPESVETQAGWKRVALQARRAASGAESEDAGAGDGGRWRWWREERETGRWKRTRMRRGRSRIAGGIGDGWTALCGRATVMSGVATGLDCAAAGVVILRMEKG